MCVGFDYYSCAICNDDNDWVKHISGRLKELRQGGCPKKTWWGCVMNDMESLGLSQKDAQFRNGWKKEH